MATEEDPRNFDSVSWEGLPHDILVMILSYLTSQERRQVALTCKSWNSCLQHPVLWHRFVSQLKVPEDGKVLGAIEHHGHRIRSFVMKVQQALVENRQNACKVLNSFAKNKERRLKSLTVQFIGQNPYFYDGQEFVAELKLLFGCIGDNTQPFSLLTHVDLSGLDITFDDSLFNILADNHPNLEFLNIQNKSLVCKVSQRCMHHLVSQCKKLKDLRVFHESLSADIFTEVADQEEPCLQHLSILHRRDTKYVAVLSSEAWPTLVKKIPSLRVTLSFDHTCPLNRVSKVMQPEIPVTELRLETFTFIHEEVNLATSLYHKTLEKVVLHTRNTEELGQALVRMAENCHRLHSLLVYCVLNQDVIDQILDLRPQMRQQGSYILKSTMTEGPWVVGAETVEEALAILSEQH